ncbi:hypothetical protein JW926_02655 [Candidatus Sumerlaeota bacterium]|nr:hypothetical protein [Candidatus Sumerlaeota bacterium]
MKKQFFLALILSLLLFPSGTQEISNTDENYVLINWNRSDGQINRPIFSAQGFMQVYACENPMVMDTFILLNPRETHTRLETYIHQMEPENDNDDPNRFNWEKLYPQKMIRFIDDANSFHKTLSELGMEPLSLLCYLAPWLKSDNPDYPIANLDEWAEFAAAVVQSYNGFGNYYQPNLRYVEIWNEPNMKEFYSGNMDSYFKLFQKTAERIHRDYPGVMVGGPALTHAWHCNPDEWMEEFLKTCGSCADFISYHHYGPKGESVDVLTGDIKKWVAKFRSIPGKEQGKVMITELDAWFSGWDKAKYMLERQFRFLDISDLILGIHHFCCLAYNESGNYAFGIVNAQGGVLEGTFYPYWLFRNLIGNKAYWLKQGAEMRDIDIAASSVSDKNSWLASAVLYNKKNAPQNIDVYLYFPPSHKDRIMTFNKITENFYGLEKALLVPAYESRMKLALNLSPGEGLSLNLQESGARFFPFRDLNNQETPWIQVTPSTRRLDFGTSCSLDVRILNAAFTPVSGVIEIRGLPDDWKLKTTSQTNRVESLSFGKEQTCAFTFTASSIVPSGMVSPYAVIKSETWEGDHIDMIPHSIPATIKINNPIRTQVLPLPVHAVPGETNHVTLQIENRIQNAIEGTFEFIAPEGCAGSDLSQKFDLEPKERGRFHFPFTMEASAETGAFKGAIKINYLGSIHTDEFTVEIGEETTGRNAVPLNLSPWLNFDAVAFFENRLDYDRREMGLFVYPGDFTPSDQTVSIRGIPYQFASMNDGLKNVVLPQGQVITVLEGKYKGVSFIGFGHDGKHPGEWKLIYADGASQSVSSEIPEWCTPPPKGFQVAFTAPYRYIEGGPAPPPCELFEWKLSVDLEKNLKGIELPSMNKAYIFAITLIREQ